MPVIDLESVVCIYYLFLLKTERERERERSPLTSLSKVSVDQASLEGAEISLSLPPECWD